MRPNSPRLARRATCLSEYAAPHAVGAQNWYVARQSSNCQSSTRSAGGPRSPLRSRGRRPSTRRRRRGANGDTMPSSRSLCKLGESDGPRAFSNPTSDGAFHNHGRELSSISLRPALRFFSAWDLVFFFSLACPGASAVSASSVAADWLLFFIFVSLCGPCSTP